MGGLGHCLAGVLPALGQVRDVIVRPPIRDRRRQKLQKCFKQPAWERCFCYFCRLLSRIAFSSCVGGHVDVSFAFSAHRCVELAAVCCCRLFPCVFITLGRSFPCLSQTGKGFILTFGKGTMQSTIRVLLLEFQI